MLVPKQPRRLPVPNEKVLALYALGMSTRDIALQLEELYSTQISPATISEMTDTVRGDVTVWQCRPLDELYTIVYLDALYVISKSPDG